VAATARTFNSVTVTQCRGCPNATSNSGWGVRHPHNFGLPCDL